MKIQKRGGGAFIYLIFSLQMGMCVFCCSAIPLTLVLILVPFYHSSDHCLGLFS